jgi:hypothetical protein
MPSVLYHARCSAATSRMQPSAGQQRCSKKSRKVAMAQLLQAPSSIYVMCVVCARVLRLLQHRGAVNRKQKHCAAFENAEEAQDITTNQFKTKYRSAPKNRNDETLFSCYFSRNENEEEF